MISVAVILSALLGACKANAYDSSAGARVAELLSRVEFQSSALPSVNPVALRWDPSRRAGFLERLARVLKELPLDIAALPPVRRIAVSDSRFVCSPGFQEELLRVRGWKDEDFSLAYALGCGDNAYWDPKEGEVAVAGKYLLEMETQRFEGSGTDGVSATVLHELFHAWQANHAAQLRAFYRLRYDKIGRSWDRITTAHFKHHHRLILRTLEQARAGALPYENLERIWKEDLQANGRIEGALYRAYRYPSRHQEEDQPEMHPMDNAHEYSAALVELLWSEPHKASENYSPAEIQWIRHYVFQEGLRPGPPGLGPRVAPEALKRTLGAAEALAHGLR